jgi:chorismate-pyruvate lyase
MQATRDLNLFYPLNEFYEQSGKPLPSVVRVEAQEMPQPYRRLLVHENPMTLTLEETYHRSLRLHVLKSALFGNVLVRQVVLVLDGDGKAVEFGGIKIHLEHFPPQARQLVLEGKQPLGSILDSQGIERTGIPQYYFQVMADALIADALHLKGPCLLYGRRNTLLDSSQRTLAEIVEILPPANGFSGPEKRREQI